MSHHCVDWIPSDIRSACNIVWTLDFGIEDYMMPKVWIEHGIPDNHVLSREQFRKDVHYLCSNDWTYKGLKEAGMKAYHTGHIFLDKTIPEKREKRLFVYSPQHCRMEHHNLPVEWNNEPLTVEKLDEFCELYECDGHVTSIVDDTQRDLFIGYNVMCSNRFLDGGQSHFEKCKYLYENAKYVYTDIMSTFDIAAQAHGIPVLGRDKQNMPRPYDHIDVLVDGKSCERIVSTIQEIIKKEC